MNLRVTLILELMILSVLHKTVGLNSHRTKTEIKAKRRSKKILKKNFAFASSFNPYEWA